MPETRPETKKSEALMKKTCISIFSYAAVLFPLIAYADGSALTAKVGTLGLGLEYTQSLSPTLNGRLGINNYSYDYSGIESDIAYNFDLNLNSLSALLDWHPGARTFRVSGGLLYNKNKINAVATGTGTVNIGGTDYPAASLGSLYGTIGFNKTAPYFGIGWDNVVGKNKGLGVSADLGVVFQGSPKAHLTASGPIASDPDFKSRLAKEEGELQDALNNYKYYPVISVGVYYSFN